MFPDITRRREGAGVGRDAEPEHFVQQPTKETHGVGDVVGSACRKAQELGQEVSDPWHISGEIDLALRRARLE
jgi:hypothetical protein